MINRRNRSVRDRHGLLLFSQLDNELLDHVLIGWQRRDAMASHKAHQDSEQGRYRQRYHLANCRNRSVHDRHGLLLFSQPDDELLDHVLIGWQRRDAMASHKAHQDSERGQYRQRKETT
jgi:hypothetical protein